MADEEKKGNEYNKVRYNNEFNKKAYDRINLMVGKGKKDIIKAVADTNGESVNAFINRAIDKLITEESANKN